MSLSSSRSFRLVWCSEIYHCDKEILLLHPVPRNLNSVYSFTFHVLRFILILSSQRRLCKLKVSNKSFVVLSYLPRVCYKAHIPYSASFTLLKLLCLKFIIFSRVPTLFSFIPLAIKIACLYWADEQTFSFIKVVLYLIKSLDFQLVHYLTKIFISTSLTYILHSMVRQAVLGSLEKTSAQFILERAFCCGGYNIVLVYIPRYVTFKYGSIILVHPTINFSIPLVEKT